MEVTQERGALECSPQLDVLQARPDAVEHFASARGCSAGVASSTSLGVSRHYRRAGHQREDRKALGPTITPSLLRGDKIIWMRNHRSRRNLEGWLRRKTAPGSAGAETDAATATATASAPCTAKAAMTPSRFPGRWPLRPES